MDRRESRLYKTRRRGGADRDRMRWLRCAALRVAIRNTMTQRELEGRREGLRARYRAALEILGAGHRAQMEELERRWQVEREAEPVALSAVESPRAPRNAVVLDELREALDQLPEEFRKDDALRNLGFSPHRSTLF